MCGGGTLEKKRSDLALLPDSKRGKTGGADKKKGVVSAFAARTLGAKQKVARREERSLKTTKDKTHTKQERMGKKKKSNEGGGREITAYRNARPILASEKRSPKQEGNEGETSGKGWLKYTVGVLHLYENMGKTSKIREVKSLRGEYPSPNSTLWSNKAERKEKHLQNGYKK